MTKFNVKGKGVSVVIEEIKQRVKAKAAKVKRCDDRHGQFRQNRFKEGWQHTNGPETNRGNNFLGWYLGPTSTAQPTSEMANGRER